MRGTVLTSDCDNYFNNPPEQYEYQGCTANDDAGPWGVSESGVYAMEWTTDFLKLYSFSGANVPTNIDSETPDTASWGKPTMMLRNDLCDIDGHFARQKLVFNINFCGNPGGEEHGWKVESECAAKTGYETCAEYVGSEPGDFVDAFYKIQDIRVFEQGAGSGEGGEETSAEPEGEVEPTEGSVEGVEPTAGPTTSEEVVEPTEGSVEETESTADSTTEEEAVEPTAEPTVCDSYECEDIVTESEAPTPVESESPQTTVPTCEGESCPEEPAATTDGSPESSEDCESSTVQSESPQPSEPACEGGECAQEPAVTTEASSPQTTEDCEEETPVPEAEVPVPEAEVPAPVESESPPPAGHEDVPEVVTPCDGYECEGEHVPEPEVPAPEPEEPVAGCTGPECQAPEHPAEEEPVIPEPVPEKPAPGCTGPECDGYTEQPEEHVPEPEESSSPVVEEPVVDEPVADEPVDEMPVGEEPVAEEPIPEPSIPAGDDGSYEEEPVEEPVGEEPVGEEPVGEEPVGEEPLPCVGPECEPGSGTASDIPGSVPTGPVEVIGAGAKRSVSLFAALVAVFAL